MSDPENAPELERWGIRRRRSNETVFRRPECRFGMLRLRASERGRTPKVSAPLARNAWPLCRCSEWSDTSVGRESRPPPPMRLDPARSSGVAYLPGVSGFSSAGSCDSVSGSSNSTWPPAAMMRAIASSSLAIFSSKDSLRRSMA